VIEIGFGAEKSDEGRRRGCSDRMAIKSTAGPRMSRWSDKTGAFLRWFQAGADGHLAARIAFDKKTGGTSQASAKNEAGGSQEGKILFHFFRRGGTETPWSGGLRSSAGRSVARSRPIIAGSP